MTDVTNNKEIPVFRLYFMLVVFVLAIGPPDAFACEDPLDRQPEVTDVYDIDPGAAVLPWNGPAVADPHGADNDCDGDSETPAMREPHGWPETCDSTMGWHVRGVICYC